LGKAEERRQAIINLIEVLARTCNGRLTAQEVLGHEEFVLTKLYESA
jgi:(2R)-sulfolactate sulfo-lyase subunit beta